MNNSHQYNPLWNPDWFLSVILDNHIDAMVARYSCLLTLRLDFFYKRIPRYLHQDHHALERDLRLLMNKMMQKLLLWAISGSLNGQPIMASMHMLHTGWMGIKRKDLSFCTAGRRILEAVNPTGGLF